MKEVKNATIVNNEEFEVKEINNNPLSILHDKKLDEWWLILGTDKLKKYEDELKATAAANLYDWDILGPIILRIARQQALDVFTKFTE